MDFARAVKIGASEQDGVKRGSGVGGASKQKSFALYGFVECNPAGEHLSAGTNGREPAMPCHAMQFVINPDRSYPNHADPCLEKVWECWQRIVPFPVLFRIAPKF